MMITEERKVLFSEIMDLGMRISADTRADVFLYYMPHIQVIRAEVYLTGWEDKKPQDEILEAMLDADRFIGSRFFKNRVTLEDMRDRLAQIRKEVTGGEESQKS